MNKDDLLKMAQNPNFISGIYNYCDRWCERCQFTSRCLLYALEKKESLDASTHDTDNEVFWKKMHEVFEETLEMIMGYAREQGLDLQSIDIKSEVEDEQLKRNRQSNTRSQSLPAAIRK